MTTMPATLTVSTSDPTRSMIAALQRIIATPSDTTATVARLALGAMILPHGMQKLLGAFGGFGFSGTMGYLTDTVGVPWIFALLAIVAEFFGGLGLLVGLFGRVAALGVAGVMVVAVATTHLQNGFFMNWAGTAAGEGWEFHLLAIALAIVVMIRGSGAGSLDRVLTRKTRAQ